MASCVKRENVNCLNPKWIKDGKCVPPKGRVCTKMSLGRLTNDSRSRVEKVVDAFDGFRRRPSR